MTESAAADSAHNRFSFGAWLFLRALAAIYAIAFVSFWRQSAGLVGPNGILPAQPFFDAVHAQLGPRAYLELPSLCWWWGADRSLPLLCAAGLVCSALLFAGIAPALSLGALWAVYLSLCGAGQIFYGFQWDSLLLEASVLAVFLAPWSLLPRWRRFEPPRLSLLLLWWLLFRLMVLSGAAKLMSGDPTWRDLTALTFHYETQPLPTAIGWYAHQLPAWFQRVSALLMFAVELLVPFALFAPRAFRHLAALLITVFMVLIGLTGNYTFFNFLTAALCVLWLDDAWWQRVLRRPKSDEGRALAPFAAPVWPLRLFAIFAFGYTAMVSLPTLGNSPTLYRLRQPVDEIVGPFRSFNSYGLFAVMTHPRPELSIEGSNDGREWLAYEFPHKPGALTRAPTWVAPMQPRLDWQLWFAALMPPEQNPWVPELCRHLLRGTPEVLALFAHNPFPGQPPRLVRVVRYEYHFTDPAALRRTGHWWRRTPLDYYVSPLSLR
ncbi:MAG: hypothetical protein JWM88_1796 [Verrucomicrobia bacterium]|nr:hypothetical protein [Verrucomicrobiota bacterium]